MSYDPHDPTVDNTTGDPVVEMYETHIAQLNARIDDQMRAHEHFITRDDRQRAALRAIAHAQPVAHEDGWAFSRRLKTLAYTALNPPQYAKDTAQLATDVERMFGT